MKRPSTMVLIGLGIICILGFAISRYSGPTVTAQAGRPLLILHWEEDFQGRALEVMQSLPDLPVETDIYGNRFEWNDQARSIVIVSGTWRLFQNGRHNTKLDDTPVEALDVRAKEKEAGWSCLVSGSSTGPVELPNGAVGGFNTDISSIELVSVENLPDWSAPGGAGVKK